MLVFQCLVRQVWIIIWATTGFGGREYIVISVLQVYSTLSDAVLFSYWLGIDFSWAASIFAFCRNCWTDASVSAALLSFLTSSKPKQEPFYIVFLLSFFLLCHEVFSLEVIFLNDRTVWDFSDFVLWQKGKIERLEAGCLQMVQAPAWEEQPRDLHMVLLV